MAINRADVEAIFHEARSKEPRDRADYLDDACGDDAALRQRVEQFLSVQPEIGSFLESVAAGQPVFLAGAAPSVSDRVTVDLPIREGPGTVIGPYKLLEQIGEGGFGVVFMAEQQAPVRRKVALKVLKPGMDTRQVVVRFEAERQALALMDHPNIAHVFDGGATESGRPYFVMELVRGITITEYCDQHQLPPRQRLELFIDVCKAVQHAHQKGIIHRDIKPSNVMVTLHDGLPVVKVIDFGVAKATGQQLTDKTLFTGFAQMIGTPTYMSPEQAGLSSLDADTRSDVYSLGVLLYELLTGTTPFRKERFKEANYEEIRRIIREEEPTRPSNRISTLGQAASTIATHRHTNPKHLHQFCRGELDWIVMKCLEKDRDRRYESANGLAQDVERYLHDEPVQACPPSAWYSFRKFARRNRVAALMTAAALAVVVVAGTGVWGWQHQESRRRAERELNIALTRHSVESSLEQLPEFHRRALWKQAASLLDQAEKQLGPDGDAGLRERLGQARRDTAFLRRLDEIRLAKSVWVEGRFNFARALDEYPKAFRENGFDVLNGEPRELAARLNASEVREYLLAALDDWAMEESIDKRPRILAITAAATGQAWRSQLNPLWKDGIRLAELYDGIPDNERTPAITGAVTRRLNKLGQDGIRRLESGLRQYPADFWLHFDFASLQSKERADVAIGAYRTALAIRPGTPVVLNNLGGLLFDKKEYEAAIAGYEEAIRSDRNFAPPHTGLGNVWRAKKQYDAAIAEYKEAIRLDPNDAAPHIGLGNVLQDKKEYEAAIAEYEEAIRLDPNAALPHSNLGHLLYKKKEYEAASAEYEEAIRLDPTLPAPHVGLGNVLHAKKEYDAAIAKFKGAIRLDPNAALPHSNLGHLLYKKKEYDAAIAAFKEAIHLDPHDALSRNGLGNALLGKNEYDAAGLEFEKAICFDRECAASHVGMGTVLLAKKEYDAAIAKFNEAIRLDGGCAFAYANLGLSYRQLGRLGESLKAFGQAAKLMPKDTVIQQDLRLSRQLLALDQQLTAFRQGKAKPKTPGEAALLARFASQEFKQEYVLAVRMFADAFSDNGKLIPAHRYHAARAACLAAAGTGKDADKLDDKERADLRRKALGFLRDDLQAGAQSLRDSPTSAALLAGKLKRWQSGPDLFSVRDAKELAKLPEAEQQAWRELWSDVDQLLKEAKAAFTATNLKGTLTTKDREQVHEVKMSAGNTYVIDMISDDFDTYLRLETAQQQVLAENDDISKDNLNSRIIFTPMKDDLYRIIATSFEQRGVGVYTLTIGEFQRRKQ